MIWVGLLVSALGTCLRLTANNYITLLIYMMMTGLGAVFLNANAAKIVGSWFPPQKIGPMMGVFLAASPLAMTIGTGTTAIFPSVASAFITAAGISVLAALLWIVFMKSDQVTSSVAGAGAAMSISEGLRIVIRSRAVWLVGLCLMALMGAVISIASFLPTALGERGLDSVAAGAVASTVTLGGMAGSLLAPMAAARLGQTKPLMFGLGLLSTVGTAFAWLAPQGFLLWLSLLITGIAIGGLIPMLMSIPVQLKEIGPVYAGTAGGFTATLQLFGAVVIPSFIIAPLAGTNFNLFYLLAGLCTLILSALVVFLPEVGSKAIKIAPPEPSF